jgi:predicted glutamine amidotransferase
MCGLIGFVPNKKANIDILRFKSLLLYNETRGRMSTGIYNIQGVLKDTENAFDFSEKQEWTTLNKNSVFMGHTRQPTIGYPVTMYGAQPIEFKNIVIIHNGTIYNKDELGKKYKINVEKDDTDSIVLAKILESKQFNVLDDYNGAASLLWIYKDEPDNLYYYRGESKKSEYVHVNSEERPLFKINTKEGIYFSSIKTSLSNISLSSKEIESIEEITANTVFCLSLKNIKKENVIFLTTKERCQSKIKEKVNNYKNKKHKKYDYSYQTNLYNRNNYYDDYRDEFDDYEQGSNGIYKKKNKTLTYSDIKKKVLNKLIKEKGHDQGSIFNKPYIDIIEEEEIDINRISNKRAYYNKGRYWMKGRILSGTYNLNKHGIKNEDSTSYFFIDGILLNKATKNSWKTILQNLYDNNYKFGDKAFSNLLIKHSSQPVPYYDYSTEDILFAKKEDSSFTGIYVPLFFKRGNYSFVNGCYNGVVSYNLGIGDFISTTDDKYLMVVTVFTSGFNAYEVDDKEKKELYYSNSVVEDIVLAKDLDDPDDILADIIDVAQELVEDLNDAIIKLEDFKENEEAKNLISIINDFKTNKLAM